MNTGIFVHTFIVIDTGYFYFSANSLDSFKLYKKQPILTTKFTYLFLHAAGILYSE